MKLYNSKEYGKLVDEKMRKGKLKTLRDILRGRFDYDSKTDAANFLDDDLKELKKDLRQEAIKWIKAIRLKQDWAFWNLRDSGNCMARTARAIGKPKEELSKENYEILENIYETSAVIVLKKIFNISDKDLK